jgi:phage-related protein
MTAQARTHLSLIGAVSKSQLASGDAVYALLEIRIKNRFTDSYVETMRVANVVSQENSEFAPETISFANNDYQLMSFDIGISQKSGEVPQVTLSLNDITGLIRSKMETYQGGIGSEITLHIVLSSMLDEPATSHRAETDRQISFTLGSPNLLSDSFPRRRQTRDFCQWAYKGPQCKYAGPLSSCSRTLQGDNGCAAHENTKNFGGFPGIQARDYAR